MNGETSNEARATENADLLRLIKESKMEKRFGEWVPELEAGTSPTHIPSQIIKIF